MMVQFGNSKVTTYSIKNPDGTDVGRFTVSKSSKSAKKLKKLNYNFKAVSAKILKSRTANGAAQALTEARGKAAMLRRKLRTGEYDDEELAAAILHAERMVRAAKKKKNHLEEEERAQQKGRTAQLEEFEETELETDETQNGQRDEDSGSGGSGPEEMDKEELQAMMQQLQKLMQQVMESTESADGLEDFAVELMEPEEGTEPADLEKLKRKHRADELRKVMEADMDYLKSLFQRLEREKSSLSGAKGTGTAGGSSYSGSYSGGADDLSGVSLELGGCETVAAPVETPPMEGGTLDVTL